jgi:hypothetical protein
LQAADEGEHDPYNQFADVLGRVPTYARHGIPAALMVDIFDLGSLNLVNCMMNSMIDACGQVGQAS